MPELIQLILFIKDAISGLPPFYLFLIVVIAMILFGGLPVWWVIKNKPDSLFWGAFKVTRQSTIEPALIEKTQFFLKKAHEDIEKLQGEVLSEISRLNDEEKRLTIELTSYLGPINQDRIDPAIVRVQNNRNQLKQEIVILLNGLKEDCSKLENLLEKALNKENKVDN